MGKIIVIEGINGSGKETQSRLLVDELLKRKIKAIEFSFPMYESPSGKIFKDCVLGKEDKSWFVEGYNALDPEVVCLYTAADRKYNSKLIKDYLDDDYVVILNRYTSSNMAHQGSKYQTSEDRFYMYQWIDKLEYWLLKLPKPDCTILLNLPFSHVPRLKEKQLAFDFSNDEEINQDLVLKSYLELSELYNWDVINCLLNDKVKTEEEIHQEIVDIVLKYLNV